MQGNEPGAPIEVAGAAPAWDRAQAGCLGPPVLQRGRRVWRRPSADHATVAAGCLLARRWTW